MPKKNTAVRTNPPASTRLPEQQATAGNAKLLKPGSESNAAEPVTAPLMRTSDADTIEKRARKAINNLIDSFYPTATQTFAMVIDNVSDLLYHGGTREDVESLINAAMSHRIRRELSDTFEDKPEELDKIVTRRLFDHQNEWRTDLAVISCRKGFGGTAQSVTPATISQSIRARYRDVLWERFEAFMNKATPEEILILDAIFQYHEGGSVDPVNGVDEIPLGQAFGWVLTENDTYIRIPRDLRTKVQQYINALAVVEGKGGVMAS